MEGDDLMPEPRQHRHPAPASQEEEGAVPSRRKPKLPLLVTADDPLEVLARKLQREQRDGFKVLYVGHKLIIRYTYQIDSYLSGSGCITIEHLLRLPPRGATLESIEGKSPLWMMEHTTHLTLDPEQGAEEFVTQFVQQILNDPK
jgi:hypothetical protein